ncbi:23S RNA-specific pseudouridylate synthase [Sulfuritalea hydrogenivorans sk43H]|uniref:tRNA pseudouridine synthase C n=2 Tax=Sulfuritalea hydrogenivorans TaxID=748811 RepID=W0SJB6_9PROT|nr:23S RNA-specific pseudouridylate synthase [Sulfuritalea hydrogenivorans sk43H]
MLDILYRDDFLVAINKPAGLLVHRSDIDRHETRFAVQLLRDQIGRRVHPLHRLDKGTSGVLLFALDADSAREVGGQFQRDEVGKRYLAIVRGWPPESGTIDHPLSRQFDDYGRKLGAESKTEALPAVTDYRRLATIELPDVVDRYPSSRYALVELLPKTGRQHQLRRHLKHIAHPIIGDATWGKGIHNRFFQQRFGCRRMLLACTRMELRHPRDDRMLSIEAPLEGSFASVIGALGWSEARG